MEYGQITEYIVEQEAPIAFDVYTDESDERIVRIPWQQYRAQIPYTIFLLGPTTGDKQLKIVTLSEEKA